MQIKIVNLLILLCVASAQNQRPRNCLEIRDSSENASSGEYIIYPVGSPMSVWCDMISGGGGWTVFHRRFDGSVNFYRNWAEYKRGFGNVNGGEFWLGNDNIHALTSSAVMELRVDVQGHDEQKFAEYSLFAIGDELNKYPLFIREHKSDSTLADSLTYHNWMAFSTNDAEHNTAKNCATRYQAAWWYTIRNCHFSHLNGGYEYTSENEGTVTSFATSMQWQSFNAQGYYYALKAASMKVRPVGSSSCKVKDGESFPFGACSVTCGEGVKARVFVCTFPGNGTRRTVHEEEKCDTGTPCSANY